MNRLLIALIVLTSGCATEDPGYASYLQALPTMSLQHAPQAIEIVAAFYGADASEFTVRWVTALHDSDGGAVSGVTIGCESWVLWWNDVWTSGAAADGPAISSSALAHEMAHCLIGDHNHTDLTWWGSGGRVDQANRALVGAGF